MKKILFVCIDLNSGGAERVITTLANELSVKYEIGIFMIKPSPEIKYTVLENIKLIKNNNSIFDLISIRKKIKNFGADVVVSFLAKTNILVSLALIKSNQSLVISERNDPYQNPSSKKIRVLRDLIYNNCKIKGFIFQTEDAQKYFSKKIQSKSTIIYNPLVKDLPDYVKEKNFKRIVNVGRLDAQKNQKMLIKSFSMLKNWQTYTLDIYGEGEDKNELKKYARKLGVSSNVNFKGTTKHIYKEIKNAGLFAFSSNYEGMSNALIEALALGIPTVSTNHPIGGARELIKNGENGLLCEVGNEIDFKNKMEQILLNKQYSLKISYKALELRNKLNTNNIVSQWINFLEKSSN